MSRPIYGLVLAGGKSRRMGSDKALLSYDGQRTQLQRTADLLENVSDRAFVSMRAGQSFELPSNTQAIFDTVGEVKGPLCGILSAMSAYPEADWLATACDMPHLHSETLAKLVSQHRDSPDQITAYRSSRDGRPEPLCAIYPTGKQKQLLALSQKLGTFSLRDLLLSIGVNLVDLDAPHSLDNINTTEEFEALTRNK